MIKDLQFLNTDWFWLALGVGFAVWLIFCMTSWFSARRRFTLKITVGFFAVAALVCIALKPALLQKKNKAFALLLTRGYSDFKLDSLDDGTENLVQLDYTAGSDLSTALDTLSTVIILGNGIKPYDFWQFSSVSTSFVPDKIPEGIIKIKYDQEIVEGETMNLTGFYHAPKSGNRLILQDPGGRTLDSLILQKDNGEFLLQTQSKVKGKFVYHLVEKDSMGNVLSDDPLPINVKQREILNILILNEFPSFETKYLKGFLAENGQKVLVRSKLTKGRYKFEYFNREQVPFTELSQAVLSMYDLLIIDSESLKNLPKTAKNGLKSAIIDDGLGVFIQADIPFLRGKEDLAGLKFENDRQTSIRLDQFRQTVLNTSPFTFERSFGLETIHTSENTIVSAYKRNGTGRVGTTVLDETYELLLEGKKEVYDKLWTDILSSIGKRKSTSTEWSKCEWPVYVDESFNFSVSTFETEPDARTQEGNRAALRQDFDLPEKWEGSTYASTAGWQMLRLEQDSIEVFDYFIYDTSTWKSLSDYTIRQENIRFFKSNNTLKSTENTLEMINYWWFYAVFILCMGILWLEPKLGSE